MNASFKTCTNTDIVNNYNTSTVSASADGSRASRAPAQRRQTPWLQGNATPRLGAAYRHAILGLVLGEFFLARGHFFLGGSFFALIHCGAEPVAAEPPCTVQLWYRMLSPCRLAAPLRIVVSGRLVQA